MRELLPGAEITLGYISQAPQASSVLSTLKARKVLLLPFLLTEGLHTQRDLPTAAQAASCGKELTRLPALATLLHE